MKSLFLSLSLSVFSLGSTYAQMHKFFKLDYQFVASEMPSDAEMAEIEAFQTVYVNDKLIKVSPSTLESPIYLINKESNKGSILFPEEKQFVEVSTGGTTMEAVEGMSFDFLEGKTKKIAGYDCKLAQLRIESFAEGVEASIIDFWYTEAIPSIYWGEFEMLSLIPGAVLEFTSAGNGFVVTKVSKVDVKQSEFEVPKDYTLLELDEEEANEVDSIGSLTGMQVADNRFIYSNDEGTLYGLADHDDQHITGLEFTFIDYYRDDVAIASDPNNKFGLIDINGKPVVPLKYEYVAVDYNSGEYLFSEDGKVGLLNKEGKILVKPEYDQIATMIDGKAAVSKDDLWGIIDVNGKIVIPFEYEMITELNKTNFVVYHDGRMALYNLKTNKLVKEGYDYISLSQDSPLITVQQGAKFGFINPLGEVVIPIKYTAAGTFASGEAIVAEDPDGEDQYIINMRGERVEEK